MKQKLKRLTALILSLVICIGLLPGTALAAEMEEVPVEATDTAEVAASEGETATIEEAVPEEEPEEEAAPAEEALAEEPVQAVALEDEVDTVSEIIASGTCGDNLTWTLDDTGTLTISGSGSMTDYSGSELAPWYSYGSQSEALTELVIEEGVTAIGENAFSGCYYLVSVQIPDSVTDIGAFAFENCAITSISIPEGVDAIGQSAFSGCLHLVGITLPSTLQTIGSNAFNNCQALTIVELPSRLQSIGSAAFAKSGLTELKLPEGVTFVDEDAFAECSSLVSVTVPGSLKELSRRMFYMCDHLTSVTLSEGVETIGVGAFGKCTGLTSVKLPSSLTAVSASAFWNCTGLSQISFTGDAPSFTSGCFEGVVATAYYPKDNSSWTTEVMQDYGGEITWRCEGLVDSGTCGENLTWTLDENGTLTISGTGNMTDYSDCNSVPWYSYAFGSQAEVISTLVIEEGVTSIGERAFQQCINVTSVVIPDSVTSIGNYAFLECTGLTSVSIPARTTNVGDCVFGSCSGLLTAGPIGSGCNIEFGWTEEIPDTAFQGSSLTCVTIPEGVTSIGEASFLGSGNLNHIVIPSSVTDIGPYAVRFCSQLTTAGPIGSGSNVEFGWEDSIPAYAFQSFSYLVQIAIPSSMTVLGRIGDIETAFFGCDRLEEIVVPEDSATFSSIDGVLYDKNQETILWFPKCKTQSTYTIPPTVTSIGRCAFCECTGLTEVIIPDSVESIGSYAFRGCTNLVDISIPNGVTVIGYNAFQDCSSLERVALPESLTKIYNCAFAYCVSLTSVTIPKNVTSFRGAFYGCTGLTSVIIQKGVTTVSYQAFDNCINLSEVYLPDTVTNIEGGFGGCTSLTEISIPDSVTQIGPAFVGCTGLTSVTIPFNCHLLGGSFEGCTNLSNVVLGASTSEISENTFKDCTSLSNIELSPYLWFIGESAFENCTSLTSIFIPGRVNEIRSSAFSGCTNLSSVVFGVKVPDLIAEDCFSGVTATVYHPQNSCWNTDVMKDYGGTLTWSALDSMGLGSCGSSSHPNDVQWSVDLNGTLTISGNGRMHDGLSWLVWSDIRNDITSVIIQEGVEYIGDYAFISFQNLKSVSVPASVTEIGATPFAWCPSLESILVDDNNQSFCSVDGVLMNKAQTTIIAYPEGKKSYTTPENVTEIDDNAFGENIEDLTVSANIQSVGDEIFQSAEIPDENDATVMTEDEGTSTIAADTVNVYFKGNAPIFKSKTFAGKTVQAYYPAGNSTWTSSKRQDYGGSVTWKTWNPNTTDTLTSPVITKLENVNGGIKITWGNVAGAAKYRVFVRSGNKWLTVTDTAGTTATFKGVSGLALTSGTTYRFTVRCISADGSKYTSGFDSTGMSIVYIAQPVLSGAASGATGVTVRWGKVTGAEKYRVYRKTSSTNWTKVGDTTSTSYTDTTAESGTTYTYTVRCFNSAGTACTSSYDVTGESITYIAQPAISGVANAASGVTIKWGKVAGAAKYRVFRKTSSTNWAKVGDTTSTSYTDTTAKSGTAYTYTVRCINSAGTAYTSSYDTTGKSITYIAQPAISSVANATSGVTIQWGKVTGAAKYRVFRKTSSTSWAKVGDTASTSYTDTTAKSGTTYTYTIRCINSAGTAYTSSYNTTGKSILRLSNPTVTLTNATSGVTIKWGQITGAKGYYVYRKTGSGSYSIIATIKSGSTMSYTDTAVKSKNGTSYTYAVRAYNGSTLSYYVGKSVVRLTAPTISSVTNSASKSMAVKWNKNSAATGYQVYYKTGSTAKTVTVKGNGTLSTVIKSLTKGSTYTVYVRSYKTVSGVNYYSAWSSAKTVKISK